MLIISQHASAFVSFAILSRIFPRRFVELSSHRHDRMNNWDSQQRTRSELYQIFITQMFTSRIIDNTRCRYAFRVTRFSVRICILLAKVTRDLIIGSIQTRMPRATINKIILKILEYSLSLSRSSQCVNTIFDCEKIFFNFRVARAILYSTIIRYIN